MTLSASQAAYAQSDPGSIERTIPTFEAEPKNSKTTVTREESAEAGARFSERFVLSAVNIEGATVFSSAELAQSFEPFLASEIGQAEIDKIAASITERYRRGGYLLSYAVVPEQSVSSGIVRIRVVEGYVEKVRIAGDKISAKAIQDLVGAISTDRPLRSSTLEKALGLVRGVSGVVLADTRISRSPQNPARHQLTLVLKAARYRAIAYTDNRGTIRGARLRGYASFNLASLAVPGDNVQLDLFTIPSSKFRFLYGQAKASVPLNDDGLRLSASASRGGQWKKLEGLDQNGKSRQFSAEVSRPLSMRRLLSITAHLSFDDWRSEEKRGGVMIQRDRLQVARAWLDFERTAKTRINGHVGLSQGLDLGPVTERGDPRASRPHGDGTFTKVDARVQVVRPIARRLSLRAVAEGQLASDSLLAPEEFALGGTRIGRAFDFNEATGDHGIGGMLEISYRLDAKKVKLFEVFAFADGGGAFRKRSSPGLPDEQWLSSAGIGTRLSAFGLLLSGEVGVPVATSHKSRGVRAFFSATKVF